MANEDVYFTRKKYKHKCTLPKSAEVIDELLSEYNFIKKKFCKLRLVSWNVGYRRIYSKSNKVLDKERKAHLLDHYWLIHPFSDFSYHWEIFMIIINLIQLILGPIIIIKRLKTPCLDTIILITRIIGHFNILVQFFTGYYRNDIKEIVLDRKKIKKHYLKTTLIPDIIGNFPFHRILRKLKIKSNIIVILKLSLACNAANFIKCLESLRAKRDLDLMVVRLVATMAIAGFGLLWITGIGSIAANIDLSEKGNKGSMWWLLYFNYLIIAGVSVNGFTYAGYEILCKTVGLSFGFIFRNILLVHLILFLKIYFANRLKKVHLKLEIDEFCYLKKLPQTLKAKISEFYEFKFKDVYYNENDIWSILSETMRQNILDYDTKQWFEGDIFKLCPLALRQLISINLNKEIYLKDDVIYTFTDPLSHIYFIKSGIVKQYDKKGELVHIIDEGNFFAEKALLLKEEMGHMYKAIAYENCQLFSLKKEVFLKLIYNFPEEYKVILKILKIRHEFILKNKRISHWLKLTDYFADTKNFE